MDLSGKCFSNCDTTNYCDIGLAQYICQAFKLLPQAYQINNYFDLELFVSNYNSGVYDYDTQSKNISLFYASLIASFYDAHTAICDEVVNNNPCTSNLETVQKEWLELYNLIDRDWET